MYDFFSIMYDFFINDVRGLYLFILLCTGLIVVLLFAVVSQIKNLNHNLYFVFKANGMLGEVDEEAILFTKLDKKC